MTKPTEAQVSNLVSLVWMSFLEELPDGAKITPQAAQQMTQFHQDAVRKNWDLFVPIGSDGTKAPRPEDNRCAKLCAKFCRKAMRLENTNVVTEKIYHDARIATSRLVRSRPGAPPASLCPPDP